MPSSNSSRKDRQKPTIPRLATAARVKPVRIAQLDAAPEARQRAHHAAVGVIRVAQSARRVHFPQRIGERLREAERGLVLGAACVVVATREMQIAPDVVELARLARESLREGLGFGERRERRVDAGDQPMAGRDSDQCAAAIGRFPSGGESDGVGVDRRLTFARFAPQPAAQHVERDDVVGTP